MDDILNFKIFDTHLLNDLNPSVYFRGLPSLLLNKHPYNLLYKLMAIEQNPTYHPEGNVWEHTMQVVDHAARLNYLSLNKKVFMWASLLHDIGKGTTTKIRNGKITAYGHDVEGARLARVFLSSLTNHTLFIDQTCKLVKWHMQPLFIYKNLPFAKANEMMAEISVAEVGLFSLCDRLGRGDLSDCNKKKEIEFVVQFLTICYDKLKNPHERDKIIQMIHHLEIL